LFQSQQFATAVYQSELTYRLRDLGYEIERGRSGAPEIKGYTQEYLDASSPRSQQIREYLERTGHSSKESAEIAAHSTRDRKEILSPREVLAAHRRLAVDLGNQPEAVVRSARESLYNKPEDFVFPSERLQGSKPLDLASVLKKKIQPAFRRIGITGVGWHTFRHSVGTMLAEMGEHQLTIRDYLRHSNLHVTNKYLQATSKTKRLAQDKLVDAILPTGILPEDKPDPMNAVGERFRMGPFSSGAYRPLTSPDLLEVRFASA